MLLWSLCGDEDDDDGDHDDNINSHDNKFDVLNPENPQRIFPTTFAVILSFPLSPKNSLRLHLLTIQRGLGDTRCEINMFTVTMSQVHNYF